MCIDMTNARAAVCALTEPLVQQCPELTVDRVISDYIVSNATRAHERDEYRVCRYRVSRQNWRIVCRQRIGHLDFLTERNWRAVY